MVYTAFMLPVSKYQQKRGQSPWIFPPGFLFRRVLTFAVLFAWAAGGKSLLNKKETTDSPVVEQGFLWKSVNNMQKNRDMTFHFFCDGDRHQPRVVLRAEGLPDFVKGAPAILRTAVGNAPPSGKGYKKFIYTGEFSKGEKALFISERQAQRFTRELHILQRQISENRKTAGEEYQEKINYCKNLPEDRRQKCYQSSSGYQPVRPLMFLTVTVEEGGKSKDFFALFAPELLKNRNLSCSGRPAGSSIRQPKHTDHL